MRGREAEGQRAKERRSEKEEKRKKERKQRQKRKSGRGWGCVVALQTHIDASGVERTVVGGYG